MEAHEDLSREENIGWIESLATKTGRGELWEKNAHDRRRLEISAMIQTL
jgi:hypothetical protein